MHNVNKVLDSQSNCRITKKSSWTLFLCKSRNVESLFTRFKSNFFCEITEISQYKDTLLIINYCFCSIFIYLLILQPNAVKV